MSIMLSSKDARGMGSDSPALIQRHRVRVRPGEIEMIVRVARCVAGRGHPLRLAVRQGLRGNALRLKLVRRLNHRDRQPRGDVPFHVAMQEPNSRIVRLESHHRVAGWGHHHSISLHRDLGESGCVSIILDDCVVVLVFVARDIHAGASSDELHYVTVHV